jgi:hypothetical protein
MKCPKRFWFHCWHVVDVWVVMLPDDAHGKHVRVPMLEARWQLEKCCHCGKERDRQPVSISENVRHSRALRQKEAS